MKLALIVAGLLAATVATPASAAIYTWSFSDENNPGNVVEGTIDLVEGFNDGSAANPIVTQTLGNTLLGGGWSIFQGGSGFVVTNGVVTASDMSYARNGNVQRLYFGSTPADQWVPQLVDDDTGTNQFRQASGTSFALAPGAPAPELGMGLLAAASALGAGGLMRRRKVRVRIAAAA